MEEYIKQLQQVESIIRATNTSLEPYIVAQVAQHLCVKISGTIEVAIRHHITSALSVGCHPRAANFIQRRLARFQNPKPGKIMELYGSIDQQWSHDIEVFWNPKVRDSISSIVSNRNKIAHGESTTVSMSSIKDWAEDAKRFCNFINKSLK
jgi:hypothetical protein